MFDREIMTIMSWDLLNQLSANGQLTVAQFATLQSMLIRFNIPYGLEFTVGTRKDAPAAVININITPTSSMVFNVTFIDVGL